MVLVLKLPVDFDLPQRFEKFYFLFPMLVLKNGGRRSRVGKIQIIFFRKQIVLFKSKVGGCFENFGLFIRFIKSGYGILITNHIGFRFGHIRVPIA